MPDLKSLEHTTPEVLVGVVVGALLAAAVLGNCRNRKRDQRINTPIDPLEVRRKRLAMLQSSQAIPIAPTATATVTAAAASNEVASSSPDLSRAAQKKRTGNRRNVPTKSVSTAGKTESRADLRRRREAFVAAAALSAEDVAVNGQDEDGISNNNSDTNNNAGLADESKSSAQTPEVPAASGSTAAASVPTVESEAAQPIGSSVSAPGTASSQETSAHKKQQQQMAPLPESPSPAATAPTALSSDLPGSMQLDDLFELLHSGTRPAYNALIDIVGEQANDRVRGSRGRQGDRHAGPDTTVGVCRRWWDAAWGAGKVEAASVAADALRLHLDAMKDDLFTSAEEQRAAVLLAFLVTTPSPIMVRHVFVGNPSAARATLRLAVAPVKREHSSGTASGGRLRADGGAAATVTAAAMANTTRRLESWQPLEGLGSLEGLFRSAAGAAALAVVLGLEARQQHPFGAAFEAESVLGPLLGGLPCVFSLNEHLRVAQESAGAGPFSPPSTVGNQLAQRASEEAWRKVPVAHRLAKLLVELKRAGPRARNALVHQYNASYQAKSRNRESFVALVEAALVKAMTTKGIMRESKSDICAWLSTAIFLHEGLPEMCNDRGAAELLGGEGSTCASSAFLMSLTALLLRMGAEKFSSLGAKDMDSIDIAYVESGSVQWGGEEPAAAAASGEDGDLDEESGDEGTNKGGEGRTDAAAVPPPYRERGVEEEKGREPEEHHRGNSTSTEGSNDGGEGGQDQEQQQGREGKEQQRRRGFNFATELFFLTHRALQVIVASLHKRREEESRILHDTALARTGLALHDEDEGADLAAAPFGDGAAAKLQLRVYEEASSAMSLGWALEGFGSDAVTGHACQLAIFTASWLGLYMDRALAGGIGLSGYGVISLAPASSSTTFSTITPVLIETICSSWMTAALNGRDDQFLTRRGAEDAAQFCGQTMERVDLKLSTVTQSKLVEVLETLVLTGTMALEEDEKGRVRSNANRAGARSGGFKGSMYWGSRRGYAGAILDSEELRQTLPRQLMRLYTSLQQVEGLAADLFVSYFKYQVRMRIGKIILHLWSHPLQEPRQAILDLVRASQPTTPTAAHSPPPSPSTGAGSGDGGGGGGGSAAAGGAPPPVNTLATDFFKTAFDTSTYFMNDAIGRLRDGVIEERSNGGRVLETGHAHWNKYMRERKQCVGSLKHQTHSILTLLTTLGEEKEVMDALRVGTLGARSASLISVMFRSLYGEESAELAVADPVAWGLDKADLGGMTCALLVGLTAHGATAATRTFAAALHDVDPEFDSELLQAVAAGEGGACLGGMVLESLLQALEEDDKERRKAAEEQAAAAGAGGGHSGVGDPFEGVLEAAEGVDTDELVRQYGDAMTELVHTQVESLSPGHDFDSRREGSVLRQPRKVATEVMRKLPRLLPNPPHPNSAVFAVLEEDALNVSRFVVSGPVDTPYENGLFVFDVFLPENYPTDPPLVQMVTTGQGTVKFNANLYADGKVCLSILGTASGASAASGEAWNPETSSLWQVFASIQTMVLLKDPYYNEGGGRSNMRGRGTAETEEASAHENARVTLETIRHAAVANLRHPPKGCEELIRCHFRALRNRILGRCKKAVEEAPNERLKQATLRASADLRAEMDKLS